MRSQKLKLKIFVILIQKLKRSAHAFHNLVPLAKVKLSRDVILNVLFNISFNMPNTRISFFLENFLSWGKIFLSLRGLDPAGLLLHPSKLSTGGFLISNFVA